jgi:uncharacterized membrane-anchored protein YitT (DUF2179 family)
MNIAISGLKLLARAVLGLAAGYVAGWFIVGLLNLLIWLAGGDPAVTHDEVVAVRFLAMFMGIGIGMLVPVFGDI